jgi:hypothetical protein
MSTDFMTPDFYAPGASKASRFLRLALSFLRQNLATLGDTAGRKPGQSLPQKWTDALLKLLARAEFRSKNVNV